MEIKPISCSHVPDTGAQLDESICTDSETVNIYNKIRERLVFEVFTSLKLERISIDSIDSVLPLNTPCLSEYRRCCKVENPDITYHGVSDFSTSENCAQNFESLKLNDACKNPDIERSLFKFIDSKNRYMSTDFKINELTLESVSV
jgi:hypothetical protein